MREAMRMPSDDAQGSVSADVPEYLRGNTALNGAIHGESAPMDSTCFHSLAVGLRLAKAYRRRYGAGPRNIT
jgi:hypothetical protein